MDRVPPAFAILAVVAGFALSSPAAAVTQNRFQLYTGASICTLSVPTTDTKVRPRATGFNNEGTTNAFVICTFGPTPGSVGVSSTIGYKAVLLGFKSLDGAEHSVNCTAMNSYADGIAAGFAAPVYVAKTITVNNTGAYGTFGSIATWSPLDFTGSGTDTLIPAADGAFSITCVLPPQVSIKYASVLSIEDVGS